MLKILLLLLSTACAGPPIQPYCPGPANNCSQIHFFGDSITYGNPSASDGSNPFGYAQMMGLDLNLSVDDVAVPGSVIDSCGQLPSILGSQINSGQTYVFFTGTNDAHANNGADLDQFAIDFQTAYDHLNVSGTTLLFMGPYYLARDITREDQKVVDNYNNVVQAIAGPLYVDLREVVDPNQMLIDGIHPNSIGQRAIANKMELALINLKGYQNE